jgi:hypothetical protein
MRLMPVELSFLASWFAETYDHQADGAGPTLFLCRAKLSSRGENEMLRIHFSDAHLARTRLAAAPHPLMEIAARLHRFQTRKGRWAYAGWYRTARQQLREKGLERLVRRVLLPLYPRAAYYPDFLTPAQGVGGWEAGAESILATPAQRVLQEIAILDRTVGAPAWAGQLARLEARKEFVGMLHAYYDAVVVPYKEHVQARIEAERAARCRDSSMVGWRACSRDSGP